MNSSGCSCGTVTNGLLVSWSYYEGYEVGLSTLSIAEVIWLISRAESCSSGPQIIAMSAGVSPFL